MDPPTQIVLPGDPVDPSVFLPPSRPDAQKRPLRIGPGLRLLLPRGDLVPSISGRIATDRRKALLWIEGGGGRYAPTTGDLVIGQVVHTTADQVNVTLATRDDTAPLRAILPVLAFAGASRKNRPDLHQGTLVYARVAFAAKHMDTELECVDPATGKSDGGLGVLTGGMLFSVSLRMARRLLMAAPATSAGLVVLDALAQQGLAYETAVGRNGRLWVNSDDLRTVLLVGRAITTTDAQNLDVRQQRALVRQLVRPGHG